LTAAEAIGEQVLIVKKGSVDIISNGVKDIASVLCETKGSGRRCGGQGDLLSGSLAVFTHWSSKQEDKVLPYISACYAACRLIRECNAATFKTKGRGMLASDMIDEVAPTFARLFEKNC
jgi:ATP-dependent NAD(P)H-hydrate dehydratase